MIKFENVSKRYGKNAVIDKLSFEIPDGQFVVLIGPSGCGKTTTLKMINRLIDPDEGTIEINGKNAETEDKVKLRREIGYVIQQIGLFPNMTVAQNICVVPKLLKYDKERCDKIVHEMLQMVNMPYEEYAHKYPCEMSGGQQQRIGVLRAFAASPPIVLMDEPFGALDPMTRETLQDEIKKLQKKLNKTIVFVTHDMGEALKLADTIIFMEGG
ncbi:MAG: ABC transporter ATP-binding protein, partial [Oscillospiraceae bacterium]